HFLGMAAHARLTLLTARPAPPLRSGAAAHRSRLAFSMSATGSGYSPGLKGVVAGETSLAMIDGAQGRLQYRGYPIGELVEHGTYARVAEQLWTGEWPTKADGAHLACVPLSAAVVGTLRELPRDSNAMDALRTGLSTWGAEAGLTWPPSAEQARSVTAVAPSVLAAFA